MDSQLTVEDFAETFRLREATEKFIEKWAPAGRIAEFGADLRVVSQCCADLMTAVLKAKGIIK